MKPAEEGATPWEDKSQTLFVERREDRRTADSRNVNYHFISVSSYHSLSVLSTRVTRSVQLSTEGIHLQEYRATIVIQSNL